MIIIIMIIICIYTYIHVYTCMYMSIYAWTPICLCIRVYTYIYICTFVFKYLGSLSDSQRLCLKAGYGHLQGVSIALETIRVNVHPGQNPWDAGNSSHELSTAQNFWTSKHERKIWVWFSLWAMRNSGLAESKVLLGFVFPFFRFLSKLVCEWTLMWSRDHWKPSHMWILDDICDTKDCLQSGVCNLLFDLRRKRADFGLLSGQYSFI
jgi:hypothetical protein